VTHITRVLSEIKRAISTKNPIQLKTLSDKTIHEASSSQDPGHITLAVVVYALSKIIERRDYDRIKRWDLFSKKIESTIDLAIKAIQDKNMSAYDSYLLRARKSIESISINIKPYIAQVLRKAAINKGSKIYEHGISLEQTAQLLGITQWELSEYVGQRNISDVKENLTQSTKQRAKMALEFFS